jgi:hypothetical protein
MQLSKHMVHLNSQCLLCGSVVSLVTQVLFRDRPASSDFVVCNVILGLLWIWLLTQAWTSRTIPDRFEVNRGGVRTQKPYYTFWLMYWGFMTTCFTVPIAIGFVIANQ